MNKFYLDHQRQVESVVGSAITAMAPDVVLQYSPPPPFNLINPSDDQPGRAWLSPILMDHTTQECPFFCQRYDSDRNPFLKFFR